MNHLSLLLIVLMLGCFMQSSQTAEKPRLIVLTDIGGDPDDQQSLIRLLLYANEFDIEALIASASGTPGELGEELVQPQLIQEIVEAYGDVRGNLLLHASGYPTESYLLDRIKSGNPFRGWSAVGSGKDTEGSNYIISVVDKNDARPVNISIWGGQTDLAQALWKVKNSRSTSAYNSFIAKLRIHDIADQDNIYSGIKSAHPNLWYVLNEAPSGVDKREAVFRGMYLGGDESLTSRTWLNSHVRQNHGPMGALYPFATWTAPNPHNGLKEGDTPSWFYFRRDGLGNPDHPSYGSWGGRFKRSSGGGDWYVDAKDNYAGNTLARATVYRWRSDFQNAFRARMDWCVKSFANANHEPTASISGGNTINVTSGSSVALQGNGSDPDGDNLSYKWWHYKEPGSYSGNISISNSQNKNASFIAPSVSSSKTIHIILEVSDNGSPSLKAYQRLIVTVTPDSPDPADPSVITAPASTAVFQPGQTVTATGTGDNLYWEIDLVTDGQPYFASGSGPSISFTVPSNASTAQVIEIRLSGDGGSVIQTHSIHVPQQPPSGELVADDFNDNSIRSDWLLHGNGSASETNGEIQIQTANSSSTWQGIGLTQHVKIDLSTALVYDLDVTIPDTSANQYMAMFLTPALQFNADGTAVSTLRLQARGSTLSVYSSGGLDQNIGTVSAGQTYHIQMTISETQLSVSVDGSTLFAGAHQHTDLQNGAYVGFRAANKSDAGGGIARFDNFLIPEQTPVEPTLITAPTAGSVLNPGQTVTATGIGDNLSWEIDLVTDGLPYFASADGPQITFTVPEGADETQIITVKLMGDGGTVERNFTIEVDDEPQGLVSDLVVANGKAYEWFDAALAQQPYIDRQYVITALDASLQGAICLRTANDDKQSATASTLVSFKVNEDAHVYVIYTNVNTTLEADWCNSANGWSDDSSQFEIDLAGNEAVRVLRRKFVAAGTVLNLPGNGGLNATCSMYNVIVVPGTDDQVDFAAAINFQPAAAAVPAGYEADSGAIFADRGNGLSYGWDQAVLQTRDRNSGNAVDQRYDTLNHLQKSGNRIWELALPNGIYAVRLVAGDPSYTDQVNSFDLEGTPLNDPDGQDHFDEFDVIVEVTDGRLTLQPAGTASNAKVCFIEVTAVGAAN